MFSLPRFLLNHISFRTDRIRLPRLGRIRPQKSAFDRWCNQKIAPGRYESLPGQVSVCPCVCLFVCPCVRLWMIMRVRWATTHSLTSTKKKTLLSRSVAYSSGRTSET
ncbi:unnamed protein product, partial [Nesidiocoris tenuis]